MKSKKTATKKTVRSSSNKTKQTKPRIAKSHSLIQYKKAIKGSMGLQVRVADKLGITRGAVTQFLDAHSEIRELLNEERMKCIDTAEQEIFNQIEFDNEKDPVPAARIRQQASQFVLTKLGRDRGYADHQEIECVGDIPLTFNLIEKSVEEIKNDKLNNKPKASGTPKSS